jgi:hypothetical protein
LRRQALDESILVGGFLRRLRFPTLPAEFAGPASPHLQMQRDLERPAKGVGCAQAVVDGSRDHVAAATLGTMIIMHDALLHIAGSPCICAFTSIDGATLLASPVAAFMPIGVRTSSL